MKKVLVVILSIIALFSLSLGVISCSDNEKEKIESETAFTVYDGDGNVVEKSETTWILDEEVKAVKILGDEYTLSGKSEYPIFVENEDVEFMTFKDLKIVSDKGFGFSVWNTNGLIITLEGDNDITVNGYSEYLKTEKEIYGNIGIDLGADLTFVGDGNLDIVCKKVKTDKEIKKVFNSGIYSAVENADLSIAIDGKISIVIDKAEGTTTTNVLQTGILSDLSVFRMVKGEVEIEIKSSVCSNAEVNVYGVFGIFAFDGGLVSINVEKRSAYNSGEALALYVTENLSSVDFAVENAESIETDIGYKFAQKTAGEKVVVSLGLEENGVADGETPSDRGIVVPGPFRIVPVRDEQRIKLDPPAIMGVQEDDETVSNIVRAIKEKLCYVATDPEENGEKSTDPKSPLWALLYRDGTIFYIVTMSGGGYVITSADGETPTDELVVNLGGSQMRVRAFTPIIPSKNGETADVSGYRFFKVALKKIEGNEDGVTDETPEVQTIIFVVVGAEKYADGETVTDFGGAIIVIAPVILKGNGETPTDAIHVPFIIPRSVEENETVTDAGARIILYPITLPRDSTDGINGERADLLILAICTSRTVYIDFASGFFKIEVEESATGTVNEPNRLDSKWGVTVVDLNKIIRIITDVPIWTTEDDEDEENDNFAEWGEGDVIYVIQPVTAENQLPTASLQPRIAVIGKPWYVATARETDGECFAIVIAPSGFPDSVEADGEGAISIEGGEGQGEAGIKKEEVIYIGIIVKNTIPVQSAVIMDMENLRPVTMEYVLDDGSAGRFYRVIVTDLDGGVTDGVEDEGEQWTVSNEGETVIIIVPQGASVFFRSASIESNGENGINGSVFTGNVASQSGGAIYFILSSGFTGNFAQSGGAIYLIGANGVVENNGGEIEDVENTEGKGYEPWQDEDGDGKIKIDQEDFAEDKGETDNVRNFIESRIVTLVGEKNIDKVVDSKNKSYSFLKVKVMITDDKAIDN